MKDDKSEESKRIKLLRAGFIVSLILVFLSVCQIIFESDDNFHTLLNWFQFIIWTPISIFNWFQFKKAKEQLRENTKQEISE